MLYDILNVMFKIKGRHFLSVLSTQRHIELEYFNQIIEVEYMTHKKAFNSSTFQGTACKF